MRLPVFLDVTVLFPVPRNCQAFAPVWEHAAELVLQKLADAHSKRSDGAARPPRIALGSVDCTRRDNAQLCKEQVRALGHFFHVWAAL